MIIHALRLLEELLREEEVDRGNNSVIIKIFHFIPLYTNIKTVMKRIKVRSITPTINNIALFWAGGKMSRNKKNWEVIWYCYWGRTDQENVTLKMYNNWIQTWNNWYNKLLYRQLLYTLILLEGLPLRLNGRKTWKPPV